MLRAQDQAFLRACGGEKEQTQLVDLEDGIRAMSICDAARAASDSGCEQKIKYA